MIPSRLTGVSDLRKQSTHWVLLSDKCGLVLDATFEFLLEMCVGLEGLGKFLDGGE